MNLIGFQVSGKIKEIKQRKVCQGQIITEPSCVVDSTFPYPQGTGYWEIVLEKCQISPFFGNNSPNKKIRLVFFSEEISKSFFEKEFVVGENYLFYCTGGSGVYWPHNWEKLTK